MPARGFVGMVFKDLRSGLRPKLPAGEGFNRAAKQLQLSLWRQIRHGFSPIPYSLGPLFPVLLTASSTAQLSAIYQP
jgi:hypothetical protein